MQCERKFGTKLSYLKLAYYTLSIPYENGCKSSLLLSLGTGLPQPSVRYSFMNINEKEYCTAIFDEIIGKIVHCDETALVAVQGCRSQGCRVSLAPPPVFGR